MSTIVSWLRSMNRRPHHLAVHLDRVAELFVDTSAWYPVVVKDHPDHAAVSSVLQDAVRNTTRLVTTNLIVAETHALLLHRTNRDLALAFVKAAMEPSTIVVPSTADLEHIAVQDWLTRYADQRLSLTDAVSFAVMTQRGIRRAATLDHHFAIAGFDVQPSAPVPGGRRAKAASRR